MKQLSSVIVLCVLAALVAIGPGCGLGKTYRIGREAEKRGTSHEAYDAYCRSANKHPGSGAVASGIRRTAPQAAAFWEAQARTASSQYRYADAWRMWMRALEIQPNHPTAPDAIRRLESRYAGTIADARADWSSRGSVALAMAKPRDIYPSTGETVRASDLDQSSPSPAPVRAPETLAKADAPVGNTTVSAVETSTPGSLARGSPEVASAEPPASKIPVEQPSRSMASSKQPSREIRPAEQSSRLMASGEQPLPPVLVGSSGLVKENATWPGSNDKPTLQAAGGDAPEPSISETPGTPMDRPGRGLSAAIAQATLETEESPTPIVSVSPPRAQASTATPTEVVEAPAGVKESPVIAKEAPAGVKPPRRIGEFLKVKTLSRKDRRYPREAKIIDGITALVKDTDGDLDADIYLYCSGRRIKKIKELPVGRSATFRGRSGRAYKLTILSIHHKTHTVRIGVKPA